MSIALLLALLMQIPFLLFAQEPVTYDNRIYDVDDLTEEEVMKLIEEHYTRLKNREGYAYGNYTWPEWLELTDDERHEALQLSDEFIRKATTEELLDIFLSHPKAFSLYHVSPIEALEFTAKDFNVFAALMKRSDFADVLLSKYLVIENKYSKQGISKDPNIEHLSLMLAHPDIIKQLSKEQIESIEQQFSSEIGMSRSADYTNLLSEYSERMNSSISPFFRRNSVTVSPRAGWATLGGNSVYYYDTHTYTEHSDDWIASYVDGINIQYPDAILTGPPSVYYNCHAYIFIPQSPLQKIMPYATHMVNGDNNYYSISYNYSLGTLFHWSDGSVSGNNWTSKHTAKYSYYSNGYYQVQSKWGNGGLYIHPLNKSRSHPYTLYQWLGYKH